MEYIIKFLLGYQNLWTPLLVLIIGLLSHKTYRQGGVQLLANKMLKWYFFWCLGFYSLMGSIYHVGFPNFTAAQIGWAPSPFQYEVGVANAVFMVLGFCAFKIQTRHFQLATLIGFCVWFWGDAAGHIYQMLVNHNTAAYNSGLTLYSDIYLPIVGVVLFVMAKKRTSV